MKWNEVSADDIPVNVLYDNPTVQELMHKAEISDNLLKGIKIPYVKKDIVVMSPGVWNNFRYSADAIKYAWENTNWDSKEVRALFLDHKDERTLDWIGEVQNLRFQDNKVLADLVIIDPATALKVEYGARCGVSPKVAGDADLDLRLMNSFTFENFSIVLNPAIKTAWINNAVIDMTEEEKTKLLNKETSSLAEWDTKYVNDLPDSSFAWVESGKKDKEGKTVPRSLRHLPYKNKEGKIDLPHVRNALARINQVKGMPNDIQERVRKMLENVLKKATKNNTEVKNMSKEEIKNLEQDVKEPTKESENKEPEDAVTKLSEQVKALQAELDALKEKKPSKEEEEDAEEDSEEEPEAETKPEEEEDKELNAEMENASGALFKKAKAIKAKNPKMSWKACIAKAAKDLEDLMMNSDEHLEKFSESTNAKFEALENKIKELSDALNEKTNQVSELAQKVDEPVRLTKKTEELTQKIEELSDKELDNQIFHMFLQNQGTSLRGEEK